MEVKKGVVMVRGDDFDLVVSAAELLEKLCRSGGSLSYDSLGEAERRAVRALRERGVVEVGDTMGLAGTALFAALGALTMGIWGLVAGLLAARLANEKLVVLRDRDVCRGKVVRLY